jgi:hypothetical protein
MPTTLQSDWIDCAKALPYRDYLGRWQLTPLATQCRKVIENGEARWQYRERAETDEESSARQW